ncbi:MULTISPECIES: DUF4864 domain-containing protein [Methylobacterium]|uniref:Topoisomerase II n=2 Tax=Methylobacterium TaxID=407 RepID=A0A0C6FI44_9HYPH|nr:MULTISPECIES: DUF4864 domain-containing protein [Methylobacterium]MBK3398598.1 DUF4864 domain-containing protein [Methylobacterium ajmalii]MBK3409524.1 DUF4864 domain-containing protein [Methylobacterium ajmalii]MBK3423354.1 DUF4864 domain-containing protein [Methylobacterium ajmalii]MBZ6413188.1 DUF4864 domain-containing protein [Methylobacterium sp.]SFF43464.1 protein of unknown function [Methylobacterium sp. yr596]
MRTLVALMTLLAVGQGALAAGSGDREAARTVIRRQQEAFRQDDAATAYAQAAPAIRSIFGTPELFVGMVRQAYAAVYRNRRFEFGTDEELPDGSLAQGVRIQDQDGTDWEALYTLERDADGAWRITGCRLRKAPGSSA